MIKEYDAIVALTDAACTKHFNPRFAQLARRATAALARKRPSPLENGRAKTWACAIVYALAYVNFVFEEGQPFHMTAAELCAAFGVAERTGESRSQLVREALKMGRFDPDWYLPSQVDDDPLAWYITFNGTAVDARTMPREVQEIAYEKGLIPYLPDPD